MDTMACAEATQTIPLLLFLLGSVAMAATIKLREKLTISQTLRAIVGLRRIKRNFTINILHAATIFVPLALWVYLIQGCQTSPA